MLTYWEILTAIQSDIPIYDSYAKLWGEKLSNAYTTTTYTGTLPATLTDTKAGYLHRYKIYGNTEQTGTPTPENPIVPSECGERTGNMFNMDESEQGDGYWSSKLITATGGAFTASWAWSSEYISIIPETDYCWFSDLFRSGQYSFIAFYTAQKTFINTISKKNALDPVEYTQNNCTLFTTPANAYYMRVSIDRLSTTNMLTEGSTSPTSYIPYGYKLPLTSGSTPVDVYIGDDTLSTEEYVDSGTGKIYRMVGGVLTPVDPPVPFPAIPTSANSTTINWAGEGIPPSQVEFIYKVKR